MESFSIMSVLKTAWEKFKEHFIFLWILGGVYMGSVIFLSLLGERFEESAFLSLIITLITIVFGTIVQLGFIKALLELVSTNEEKGIAIVFSQYHLFWRYLVASILFQFLIIFGFILLIIPGVYFMMKYQFFSYAMIDKNLGIADAFKQSAEMTRGMIWKLIGFSLALLILNVAGALFFVVGLAVTIPVTMVAYTILYFTLQKRLAISEGQKIDTVPEAENSEKIA